VTPTISSLIASTEAGDRPAADALFSALYAELRALARRQLAGSRGITLGPTTLLHEAYINIARREGTSFPDRARFLGYAAKVMRRLVIDHVRSRDAQKRGGAFEIVTLNEDDGARPAGDREIRGLALPRDSTIVAVIRDHHVVVPRGDTVLCSGDEVLVLVTSESEDDVRQLLTGS